MRNLLILAIIISLISCGKEDLTLPKITITDQTTKIIQGTPYNIDYTIVDNSLESSTLSIIDGNNEVVESKQVSGSGSYTLNISEDVTLPIFVKIEAKDTAGNINVESKKLEVLSLELTYKVQYKGQDIEYLSDYEYVDGRSIEFSKIGFFLSDIKLGDKLVQEVEYVSIPTASEALENPGYHMVSTNVTTGDYNNISFNIGVSPEKNAQKPSDFASNNPLSQAGEYWSNWNSYIFSKIEGNFDDDDNTDLEKSFALHTGIDVALMEYSFDKSIVMSDNITDENPKITFVLDLYEVFENNGDTYDIVNNRMLHSAEKLEVMKNLASRIESYLKIEEGE